MKENPLSKHLFWMISPLKTSPSRKVICQLCNQRTNSRQQLYQDMNAFNHAFNHVRFTRISKDISLSLALHNVHLQQPESRALRCISTTTNTKHRVVAPMTGTSTHPHLSLNNNGHQRNPRIRNWTVAHLQCPPVPGELPTVVIAMAMMMVSGVSVAPYMY